jgi:hypothetical protein
MAYWLILALLLFAFPALAESPAACDAREDATICELKVERNNAMDELAMTSGELRKAREHQADMVKWWSEYVAGIGVQAEWWLKYLDGVNGKASRHH